MAAWQFYDRAKLHEAYVGVQRGDTYEAVVARFGREPSWKGRCDRYQPPECSFEIAFENGLSHPDLASWIVLFDDSGRVMRKAYICSP